MNRIIKTDKINAETVGSVLSAETLLRVKEVAKGIRAHDNKKGKRLSGLTSKTGFRALFYGAPGTGKTLAATYLGQLTGKGVYSIDVDRVVSKYIGETEKNLAKILNANQSSDAILLFDEADALFGKMTNIRDAHDKYANQEVSWLLKELEKYGYPVIFITRTKPDLAGLPDRGFHAVVNFPGPDNEKRFRLRNQR